MSFKMRNWKLYKLVLVLSVVLVVYWKYSDIPELKGTKLWRREIGNWRTAQRTTTTRPGAVNADANLDFVTNVNRQKQLQESFQKEFEETALTNVNRQKHLQESCKILRYAKEKKIVTNGTEKHENKSMRFRITPQNTVAYCRVNKAASTFTMNFLVKNFNCSLKCLMNATLKVLNLPDTERRAVLEKVYKFMFVREPYQRLFSTYSNKFYFPKNHWAPIGPNIVKRYRRNPSKDSLKYGHNVTFAELIKYTVEEFNRGAKLDPHIQPMHPSCNPCDNQFDFIGKLETMKQDWRFLSQEWVNRNILRSAPSISAERDNTALFVLRHIPKTLSIVKNSTIPLHKLYLRAWTYFQLSGYISKRMDMPFGDNGHSISYEDFVQEVQQAINQTEANVQEIAAVKAQKQEALLQAYSTVSLEMLERLRRVVFEDCMLYGYHDRPAWLFNRKSSNQIVTSFDYFKGLA